MERASAAHAEPISVEGPRQPWPPTLKIGIVDVTFLHWPVDPALVRPLLPRGTEPDRFGASTYIGLIAFRMRVSGPYLSYGPFLETNVRAYSIDHRGRRGTVFLDMECDRLPWVLKARAAGLPYAWSRMSLIRDGGVLTYTSTRRWPPRTWRNRIQVQPGRPVEGSSLEHFLTARWRIHFAVPGGTVATPLFHDRWPLHEATLLDLDDQLVAATGLPISATDPIDVLYAPTVRGHFGLPALI